MYAEIIISKIYTDDLAKELESEVCGLLFEAATPLSAAIRNEDFLDGFPFPSRHPDNGKLCLRGEFTSKAVEIFSCSPYYTEPKGIPTLTLPSVCIKGHLENAYLSWLSSWKTGRYSAGKKKYLLRRSIDENGTLFAEVLNSKS